jgi:hypothetical protein
MIKIHRRRRFAGPQLPLFPGAVLDGIGWLLPCPAGALSGVGGWFVLGVQEVRDPDLLGRLRRWWPRRW